MRSDFSEKDNGKNKNKNKEVNKKGDNFERVKGKVEVYGKQRFRDTISEIYDDEEK